MNRTSSIVVSRIAVAILAAFFLAAAFPQVSYAQTDPLIGTWKLNLAKSTYSPGPAPRSGTLTVEAAGQGRTYTFDAINLAGMPVKAVFIAIDDGQPHPATGSPVADAASIRQINPYLRNYSLMKAGKEVQTGALVVSTDGKTATFFNTGVNENGQPISNVVVYEKQ
jgi:hypothetical protein